MQGITYIKLNVQDKELLRNVCRQRWYSVFKRLQYTFLLPMVAMMPVSMILNYIFLAGAEKKPPIAPFLIPTDTEELIYWFGTYLYLTIPVLMIMAVVNLVMFLWTMPAIYFDIFKNRKARIQFTPIPYYITGTDKYYIKTGIPWYRFIEVPYEAYLQVFHIKSMSIELSPMTKILLGIVKNEEQAIGISV